MLTRVLVQLVGLVLSIGPLFLLLFRLLKDGWRTTFQVSSQRRRPAALEDSKHGRHGYVQGNLFKGIDKKAGRREGIEPIKKVFTYVLFSRCTRQVDNIP